MVALFRFASLASLAALAGAPVYAYWLAEPLRTELPYYLIVEPQYIWLALLLAVLVAVRHHANIRRLFKGVEPKIGRGGG